MSTEEKKEKIAPITFVDKENPKSFSPITFIDKKDNPEKRTYIILYYAQYEEEDVKSFEICTGRTAARKFIISMIDMLDLEASKILVDGVDYEDSLTVYEFMKKMEEFFKDGFDVEEYV